MLLSILIDPRGRPEFLSQALQVLMADAGASRGEVEIVVLGSPSSSAGPASADGRSAPSLGNLPVRFASPPHDEAFSHPFEAAQDCAGAYVWFLTDGILPIGAALRALLSILRDKPKAVVFAPQTNLIKLDNFSLTRLNPRLELDYRDLVKEFGLFTGCGLLSTHIIARNLLSSREWNNFNNQSRSFSHTAYLLDRLRANSGVCLSLDSSILVEESDETAAQPSRRLSEIGSVDAIVAFAQLLEWLEMRDALGKSDFLLIREHDGSSTYLLYRQLIARISEVLTESISNGGETPYMSVQDIDRVRKRFSTASSETLSIFDGLVDAVRAHAFGWPDENDQADGRGSPGALVAMLSPERARAIRVRLRRDLLLRLHDLRIAASPDVVVMKGRTFAGMVVVREAEGCFAFPYQTGVGHHDPWGYMSEVAAGKPTHFHSVSLEQLRQKLSAVYGGSEARDNNGDLKELPGFDAASYTTTNGLGAMSYTEALTHYRQVGWRSGLNPAPDFKVGDYLTLYPDVAEAGVEPLQHFVQHGIFEGRKGWS